MIQLPRSLAIKPPYRGRTIRSVIRNRIPGGRRALEIFFKFKAGCVRRRGQRKLKQGLPQGRRFLAAIPHPFCGIGHGFTEWHTAHQWAHRLGLEFAHIPLKGDWDSFLGLHVLPTYEEVIRDCRPSIIRLPYAGGWSVDRKDVFPEVKTFIESVRSDKNLLFVLADAQNVYDHTTFSAPLRDLFYKYGERKDKPRHKVKAALNVAVHLRRGDVVDMAQNQIGNWEERYITEEWFIKIMDAISQAHKGEPVAFQIYSQGCSEDFPLLSQYPDCAFYLDAGEEESLLNMIEADILVMSPSGFSFLAAMLSDGIKIARYPWWHSIPNDDDWCRVQTEVDTGMIVKFLKQHLNA